MAGLAVGDLVAYRSNSGWGTVKGKLVDIVPDPVWHNILVVRITSRSHRYYAYGTELSVWCDDPKLVKRKRYG